MQRIRRLLTNYYRTHLKNAFGLQTADFCKISFSGLYVSPIHIVPAAEVLRRNPLVLACKAIFEMGSKHPLFWVRVEGESMYPHLIPGHAYLASNLFALRQGDFAVFRNPKETGEIFVKRVDEVRDEGYIMESSVSWGSSSRDFGPVPRRLIVGKIWR